MSSRSALSPRRGRYPGSHACVHENRLARLEQKGVDRDETEHRHFQITGQGVKVFGDFGADFISICSAPSYYPPKLLPKGDAVPSI